MVKPAAEILHGLLDRPDSEVAAFLQGRRPMILAPHPDDETLGCGGLIAAAAALGLAPLVVFLTDGAASHLGSPTYKPAALAKLRLREAREALARLSETAVAAGLKPAQAVFLGYPDGALPGSGAAAARLATALAGLGQAAGCQMLLAPWAEDPHCDHQAAASLAQAVTAEHGWPLWFYSVWGWLLPPQAPVRAVPGAALRLRIGEGLRLKSRAIAAHRSQLGEVIDDAQTSFVLPASLLAVALRPYEVVFQA